MKIELKRLALNKRLSEETNCYSAEIWIDGRRAFLASNRGHGGADVYELVGTVTEKAVDDWLRANRPPVQVSGMQIEHSLEIEVGELIELEEQVKLLKRRCRTHLITIEAEGVFSRPLKGRPAAAMAAAFKLRHADAIIVNGASDDTIRTAARSIIDASRSAEDQGGEP